jgi:lipopolysaccharide export system protein LptA
VLGTSWPIACEMTGLQVILQPGVSEQAGEAVTYLSRAARSRVGAQPARRVEPSAWFR